jgi:hypothetical protein
MSTPDSMRILYNTSLLTVSGFLEVYEEFTTTREI